MLSLKNDFESPLPVAGTYDPLVRFCTSKSMFDVMVCTVTLFVLRVLSVRAEREIVSDFWLDRVAEMTQTLFGCYRSANDFPIDTMDCHRRKAST